MSSLEMPNGSTIEILDEAPAAPMRSVEAFRTLDNGRPYFSIKGNEAEGWTLMLYRYDGRVDDEKGEWIERHPPAVTSYWQLPQEFTKFSDLLAVLLTHEAIEP